MAHYRKIYVKIWGDEKFRRLSSAPPNAQTLMLYFLSGPHTERAVPGLYHVGVGALSEALGWAPKRLLERFAELFAEGIARADWEARVVWFPRSVYYDPPDNPNIVVRWKRFFDEIPECDLKWEVYKEIKNFLERFTEPFRIPFSKPAPDRSANRIAKPKPYPKPYPKQNSLVGLLPQGSSASNGTDPEQGPDPDSPEAVLVWLNRKAGRSYRPVSANLDLIRARLKDGVLPWQLKAIISRKAEAWNKPPEPGAKDMRPYLRPATLFSKTNCEQYLGELPTPTQEQSP